MQMNKIQKLTISEKLAIDRTKLANERTFLAFFRSFVVMLSSGLAILKLEFLKNIYLIGVFLIIISVLLLVYSFIHYFRVKKRILSYK
jgi:putative membrane protein